MGRLSGGQQAQVALTIALARTPDLLVLDEPLANLDPVARHDVMRAIMAEVAEHGAERAAVLRMWSPIWRRPATGWSC